MGFTVITRRAFAASSWSVALYFAGAVVGGSASSHTAGQHLLDDEDPKFWDARLDDLRDLSPSSTSLARMENSLVPVAALRGSAVARGHEKKRGRGENKAVVVVAADEAALDNASASSSAASSSAASTGNLHAHQPLSPTGASSSTSSSSLELAGTGRKHQNELELGEDLDQMSGSKGDNWLRMLTRTMNGRKLLSRLYARALPGEHPDDVLYKHLDSVIAELQAERGGDGVDRAPSDDREEQTHADAYLPGAGGNDHAGRRHQAPASQAQHLDHDYSPRSRRTSSSQSTQSYIQGQENEEAGTETRATAARASAAPSSRSGANIKAAKHDPSSFAEQTTSSFSNIVPITQSPALKQYVDALDVLQHQAETTDTEFRAAVSFGNMASAGLDELGVDSSKRPYPYAQMITDTQDALERRNKELKKELDTSHHMAEQLLEDNLLDTVTAKGAVVPKSLVDTLAGAGGRSGAAGDEAGGQTSTAAASGGAEVSVPRDEGAEIKDAGGGGKKISADFSSDLRDDIESKMHRDPRRHQETDFRIDQLLNAQRKTSENHIRSLQIFRQEAASKDGLARQIDKEAFAAASHYDPAPVAAASDVQAAVNLDDEEN